MSRTQNERNEKVKEILAQLEGWEMPDAEGVLDMLKLDLRHHSIIRISELDHEEKQLGSHKE